MTISLSGLPEESVVSIITPSYNHGRYIEQTIQSVLSQDYPKLEYLIVDGGSTDQTVDIIKRYANRLAWWVSERDHGQADAINKGFAHAHGEIIAWLNSDDLYFQSNAVSQAVQALQAHPEVGMVYADGLLVDENLRVLDFHTYPQLSLTDLLSFKVLLQPTVFMRRAALWEAGLLPVEYNLILDHALWVLIAAKYPILHVSGLWAVERSHSSAKTISQAAHFVEEAFSFIQSLENNRAIESVIHQDHHMIYAGLHTFAGKRQIDAGNPHLALEHFRQAWHLSPKSALHVWYKVVQALGGRLGLGNLFLSYRQIRRRLVHRTSHLIVSPSGVSIAD